MTRICHLITGLDVGGAEHALARLCPALAHRGYDQIVVTMIPGGAFAQWVAATRDAALAS